MDTRKNRRHKPKKSSYRNRIVKILACLVIVAVTATATWFILGQKKEWSQKPEPDSAIEAIVPDVEKALESAGIGPKNIIEGDKELRRDADKSWYLRKRTYSISEAELMRVTISLADLENAGKIGIDTVDGANDKTHLVVIRNGGRETWRLKFLVDGAESAPHRESDPVVAVIIDDIGSEATVTGKLIELDAPITFSVLPNESHTRDMRDLIKASGREMLLHLPMEPTRMQMGAPLPGVLWTSMGPTDIRKMVAEDFGLVPEAVGVNNHMGSAFTTWEPGMRAVLEEVGKRGLFFIDSITDPHSIACNLAGRMNVKCDARDVFLDTNASEGQVEKQWHRLLGIAKRRGSAIAIGHPRNATYEVLKTEIPRLTSTNIRLVPISEVVKRNERAR